MMNRYQDDSFITTDGKQGCESQPGFLERAKKAAEIVGNDIENNTLSSIESQLKEIIEEGNGKDEYVFEQPKSKIWELTFLTGLLFSAGLLYLLPVLAGTAAYSQAYRKLSIVMVFVVLVLLGIDLAVCIKSIKEIRFSKRYSEYRKVLRFRKFGIISDIAEMLKYKKETIEKDLHKAVTEKLIPEGHFSRDKALFMMSDEAFESYLLQRAAFDRYVQNHIDERQRARMHTEELDELLRLGEEYQGKIKDYNDLIADRGITGKLDRMEEVVSAIFREAEMDPKQIHRLGSLIEYYLPTTERLLHSFIEIDEKQVKGSGLKKTQSDIIRALDAMNDTFESILEQFYEEREMNIAGEISAMEIIMQQEGMLNDDI